jgi:hypothetical protein
MRSGASYDGGGWRVVEHIQPQDQDPFERLALGLNTEVPAWRGHSSEAVWSTYEKTYLRICSAGHEKVM